MDVPLVTSRASSDSGVISSTPRGRERNLALDEELISPCLGHTGTSRFSQRRCRRPNWSLINAFRSEEHTSELQSLMRISYAVFCLKKKTQNNTIYITQE